MGVGKLNMQVRYTAKAEKFIIALRNSELSRVERIVDLLEKHGNELGLPHSRHLGGGLLELRVLGVPSFRLLYIFKGGDAYMLHGFTKKTNRTPKKEINLARAAARDIDEYNV